MSAEAAWKSALSFTERIDHISKMSDFLAVMSIRSVTIDKGTRKEHVK